MREPGFTSSHPGRPRQFDEAETLSEIMQLFWENGYEGTGLSDIIKATGLSKASLYAAYGNKQSMYLKALGHYEAQMVDSAVAALRNRNHPALDRVSAFLQAPITAVDRTSDRRGCFLCNASADRAAIDAKTGDLVRRGYAKMRGALEQTIGELGTNGESDFAKRNAQLVLTVYSGLRVMARSGTGLSDLIMAKEACLKALASCR